MKELPSEEEEIPFRIKTYKKKELACMYNPNITPRCAIRIFTKWIKINKELLRLLTATGYHPRTRTFTPRQVQIIEVVSKRWHNLFYILQFCYIFFWLCCFFLMHLATSCYIPIISGYK